MPLKNNLETVFDKLSSSLKGKIICLGIGNPLRRDDAVGSYLARNLKDKLKIKVWDAETVPENFLGAVVKEKPDTVLLVDAVDFGAQAGELALLDAAEVKTKDFFLSHDIAPRLLFDFLKENCPADIYLLAVQPKDINFGEDLGVEVKDSLFELERWFLEKYPLI